MAEFLTRVELHNEQAGDYDKLHEKMEAKGFQRYITLGGKKYHMPDATYYSSSDKTPEQVYTEAQAAATAIGRKAGVAVAKSSSDQMWMGGLKPAK
ncbi:hypothetical protein LGM63_05585 [Burkholderia cepacia]|uniref:hypothetical protein n=1 Tax=Burkholderia cepacia TaxID=292 RepID=UPI00075DD53C|nr:hypothetical protein [Burkholderia cepacia]KVW08498.1 hypothetical protein WK91_30705 [Burkholderia cepacia]MCA7990104.1 hypothetical protein [Burkholderia cepacia]